jgi:hypothetical protein
MRALATMFLFAGACTTLGPMPAATLVSALPAARPEVEVQVAAAPGYFLSSGATADPKGSAIPQLEALFEPDRLIVPGLFIAGRAVGAKESGTIVEPILGYRHAFGDGFALGALVYGSHASTTTKHATYSATRVGAEVAGDALVTGVSRWVELHLTAAISLTGLSGDGSYCLDANSQYGVDCPDPPTNLTSARGDGAYPSGSAGVALEILRHHDSVFHGGRLALVGVAGTMPTFVGGAQADATPYVSLGLSLSLAVGATEP